MEELCLTEKNGCNMEMFLALYCSTMITLLDRKDFRMFIFFSNYIHEAQNRPCLYISFGISFLSLISLCVKTHTTEYKMYIDLDQ